MALTGTSLNAATATGPGTVFSFDVPHTNFNLQASSTGSPTAADVHLEGSVDGVNWYNLSNTIDVSSGSNFSSSGDIQVYRPSMFVRANLTVLTGGTSPTVTAVFAAQ